MFLHGVPTSYSVADAYHISWPIIPPAWLNAGQVGKKHWKDESEEEERKENEKWKENRWIGTDLSSDRHRWLGHWMAASLAVKELLDWMKAELEATNWNEQMYLSYGNRNPSPMQWLQTSSMYSASRSSLTSDSLAFPGSSLVVDPMLRKLKFEKEFKPHPLELWGSDIRMR